MSGICRRRVVIVTCAGSGIGREHALEFANQGAKVVVNDPNTSFDGHGQPCSPATQVVEDIRRSGGDAVVNVDDPSDEAGAYRLIDTAIESFGRLDVLVNHAGVTRDQMFANTSLDEWDTVIRAHLRGTFAPMRAAVEHWKDRAGNGESVDARIINTTSPSGLYGRFGQSSYGAADAGIASLTVIAALELEPLGITVNAIAPAAITRMTEYLDLFDSNSDNQFDRYDPANISPLVVWLGSSESKGITGRVFNVFGGKISLAKGWAPGRELDKGNRWNYNELAGVIPILIARSEANVGGLGQRITS